MKVFVNIPNVPLEAASAVKQIADAEFDGNLSAAYRRLIAEALEARRKAADKKTEAYHDNRDLH